MSIDWVLPAIAIGAGALVVACLRVTALLADRRAVARTRSQIERVLNDDRDPALHRDKNGAASNPRSDG